MKKRIINQYIAQVGPLILANKKYDIGKVIDLTFLKGGNYTIDNYKKILNLINQGNLNDALQVLNSDTKSFEDLSVLSFLDQIGRKYVVIVYENDEMWQDPEILDIIPEY